MGSGDNVIVVCILRKETLEGKGYVCHESLIINEAKAIYFAHLHTFI